MSEEAQKNVKLPNLGIFYDNEFHDSISGKKFPTINPHNEQVIAELAEGDKEDVEKAVAAARAAFDEGPWPRMSGRERGNLLLKLAQLIEDNKEQIGTLEALDNGKPAFIAKNVDVQFSVDWVRYYAGWADKISGKTLQVGGPFCSQTLHEPIGVVGAVIPWNFPLLMLVWKFAPALACGCTIVVKTAEQTPLSALRVAELAVEAGIPKGVFNIVSGYGPTAGAALATHPLVDKLAFTGSTEIGHKMLEYTANGTLKPITLELGGKSPVVVCDDVDIDKVVEECHQALFFNMGQCCCAGSRLYVHEKIYDEFVQKAAERAKNRKVGDPFTEVEQGPQVDTEQFNKILGYIEKGKSQGAKLMCGGNRKGDCGYYIEPTVFADVTEEMDIAKDEIFGPVQSIFKFSDYNEVVKRANDNRYGLAAGIYGKNIDTINFLSRSLKAGTVWVNCYNVFDPNIPFGGYKESGIGRENGGEYVLKNFLQVKCVTTPLQNSPWL